MHYLCRFQTSDFSVSAADLLPVSVCGSAQLLRGVEEHVLEKPAVSAGPSAQVTVVLGGSACWGGGVYDGGWMQGLQQNFKHLAESMLDRWTA